MGDIIKFPERMERVEVERNVIKMIEAIQDYIEVGELTGIAIVASSEEGIVRGFVAEDEKSAVYVIEGMSDLCSEIADEGER